MQEHDIVEDFTLPDQDGNNVTLSNFKNSPVILFFYPRADTPGCTIEACGFRDTFAQLQAAGATVLGISRDKVKDQKKFAEKYSLNYPLLADHEGIICTYFGVLKPKNMYGKLVKGIERTTFVIAPADSDGEQKILKVFPQVKPEGHAEEVLALIQQSRATAGKLL